MSVVDDPGGNRASAGKRGTSEVDTCFHCSADAEPLATGARTERRPHQLAKLLSGVYVHRKTAANHLAKKGGRLPLLLSCQHRPDRSFYNATSLEDRQHNADSLNVTFVFRINGGPTEERRGDGAKMSQGSQMV